MIDFKEFREKNSLTQKEAAAYFGVSQAFISQIERGDRSIPSTFISKIKADNRYSIPEHTPPVDSANIVMQLVEKIEDLRQQLGEQINENKHLQEENTRLVEENNALRAKNERLIN